jgi:tRNA 2-thiouridine synthesizing protein A
MGTTNEKRDIAATLDMVGYFCPEPVIRVNEEIESVAVGEVLELLADDPSSESDIRSWAKRAGHELLSVSKEGGTFRFLIRRNA